MCDFLGSLCHQLLYLEGPRVLVFNHCLLALREVVKRVETCRDASDVAGLPTGRFVRLLAERQFTLLSPFDFLVPD